MQTFLRTWNNLEKTRKIFFLLCHWGKNSRREKMSSPSETPLEVVSPNKNLGHYNLGLCSYFSALKSSLYSHNFISETATREVLFLSLERGDHKAELCFYSLPRMILKLDFQFALLWNWPKTRARSLAQSRFIDISTYHWWLDKKHHFHRKGGTQDHWQ